jgi:hypothetical protein
MPDRVPSLLSVLLGYGEQIALSVIFALVGMVVGLGQLFASQEMLTTRIIVGRALSSGGLGTVAGVVVVWIPDLSFAGQIGVAAGIASLGTSALERVFQRVIGGGK